MNHRQIQSFNMASVIKTNPLYKQSADTHFISNKDVTLYTKLTTHRKTTRGANLYEDSQKLTTTISNIIDDYTLSFNTKVESFILNISKKYNIPICDLHTIADMTFNTDVISTATQSDDVDVKYDIVKSTDNLQPDVTPVETETTTITEKEKSGDFPEDILMPFIPSQVSTDLCQALKRNCGLYTQCTKKQKKNSQFCSICAREADKNNGVPKSGTVELRNQVALDAYVDPQGKKCVNYTTVLKKKNFTSVQARAYATANGFEIPDIYFVKDVTATKKNMSKAKPQENTSKNIDGTNTTTKGMKKPDIVVGGSESDDLFAALAQATENAKIVSKSSKKSTTDSKKNEDTEVVEFNEKIINGVSYHYDVETDMLYNPESGEPVGRVVNGELVPNDQLEEEEYTA